MEEGHYQTTYSYSSRVVMALDQELKEWQVRVAFLERQLETAHQENASLHHQLKEQKDVTQNTLPLQDEENKMSRKRLRGQGQNMNTERKLRIVVIVVRQIIKRKTAGRKQESALGVAVRSRGLKIALCFRKDQQGLNPTHLFNKRNQE